MACNNNTQARLINSALEVFAKFGYHGANMSDVSKKIFPSSIEQKIHSTLLKLSMETKQKDETTLSVGIDYLCQSINRIYTKNFISSFITNG